MADCAFPVFNVSLFSNTGSLSIHLEQRVPFSLDHCIGETDFLCAFFIAEDLIAFAACPVCDVSVFCTCRFFSVCFNQSMLCKLTILFTACCTDCLVRACRCSACMFILDRNMLSYNKSVAICRNNTCSHIKFVFCVQIIRCRQCSLPDSVFIHKHNRASKVFKLKATHYLRNAFRYFNCESKILCSADLINRNDCDFRDCLLSCFFSTDSALLPVLSVFTLPLICMVSVDCYSNGSLVACLVFNDNSLCAFCRVQHELVILIKRNVCVIDLHAFEVIFRNGYCWRLAICFAVFYA